LLPKSHVSPGSTMLLPQYGRQSRGQDSNVSSPPHLPSPHVALGGAKFTSFVIICVLPAVVLL
jgi:hypothetical protein